MTIIPFPGQEKRVEEVRQSQSAAFDMFVASEVTVFQDRAASLDDLDRDSFYAEVARLREVLDRWLAAAPGSP